MIQSLPAQLIYTAAFGFCALWCLWEIVRGHGWVHRVSHTLHFLMAVAMIVMVFPATVSAVPLMAQIAFFGLATVWFIAASIWAQVRKGTAAHTHGGAAHFAPHAIMMAAMTWHLAAMALIHRLMAATNHAKPMDHGSTPMDHGGHTTPAPVPMGHGASMDLPSWHLPWQILGWVIFGALLLWGIWSLVQGIRGKADAAVAHLHSTVEIRLAHLSNAAMAIAMFAITLGLLGIRIGGH